MRFYNAIGEGSDDVSGDRTTSRIRYNITPKTSTDEHTQIKLSKVTYMSRINTKTSPRLWTVRKTVTAASVRPVDQDNSTPVGQTKQLIS